MALERLPADAADLTDQERLMFQNDFAAAGIPVHPSPCPESDSGLEGTQTAA